LLDRQDFQNVQVYTKSQNWLRALQKVKIHGHLMEFGVWQGASINYMAAHYEEKTFHGFDSFEGLPEPWVLDKYVLKKNHFKTDIPKVRKNVKLHIGWFEDSIPKWKLKYPGPIAFLHCDSDLYSSCICILEGLNNRIIPGTIIVFDELIGWKHSDHQKLMNHEWKALNEWVDSNNRTVKPLFRGENCECTIIVT